MKRILLSLVLVLLVAVGGFALWLNSDIRKFSVTEVTPDLARRSARHGAALRGPARRGLGDARTPARCANLRRMSKATVRAPSNIAFIKYWGARDLERVIPTNASISMTLDFCASRSTMRI